MDTLIASAETTIATALVVALAPLVGTLNGAPCVYWREAPRGAPLPRIVCSQTDATRPATAREGARIGGPVGIARIRIACHHESALQAATLVAQLPARLITLTAVGRTLEATVLQAEATQTGRTKTSDLIVSITISTA